MTPTKTHWQRHPLTCPVPDRMNWIAQKHIICAVGHAVFEEVTNWRRNLTNFKSMFWYMYNSCTVWFTCSRHVWWKLVNWKRPNNASYMRQKILMVFRSFLMQPVKKFAKKFYRIILSKPAIHLPSFIKMDLLHTKTAISHYLINFQVMFQRHHSFNSSFFVRLLHHFFSFFYFFGPAHSTSHSFRRRTGHSLA